MVYASVLFPSAKLESNFKTFLSNYALTTKNFRFSFNCKSTLWLQASKKPIQILHSLPVSRRQLDLWKQASITETVFVYPLTLHQSVHEANQEADANLTNRLLPDSLEEHGTPSLIFATTSLLLLLGLDPQHDYYKANTRMKTGPKHIVLVTDY